MANDINKPALMSGYCSDCICILWSFLLVRCQAFFFCLSLSFALYLCHQLEGKLGKASVTGGEKDSPDLKEALKKEREEHQHLLADSYAAVMDLTKQLQISEKNWSRERLELLEHFNQERSQWDQRVRDAQSKGAQVECYIVVLGFVCSNENSVIAYLLLWC